MEPAVQQTLIRLAKRLDKVEAQLVELQGFVGYIKDKKETEEKNQKREKETKNQEEALKNLEFNTFRDNFADME